MNFTKLDPPERKRTYHFRGQSISYENVTAIEVRSSGRHRLELADGRKIIVQPDWLAVELEVDSWTF